MAKRYEDRYGRGGHPRDRERADDRGYADRATDEVRSWFGDDDAERRREMDERHDQSMHRDRDDWERRNWNRRDEWTPSRYAQRSRWSRPEDWRHTSPGASARYQDWARTWSSRGGERDRDRDLARYGQSQYGDRRAYESRYRDDDRGSYMSRDFDDRDRQPSPDTWNRDARMGGRDDRSTDYDYRNTARGASSWSTDDGRMEFGDTRYGRGPKGYQRSDNRILEDVCDRLTYSEVDAENIEVSVTNGEVTLCGHVNERWDKRRAEDIAEGISGVRDVHNNIRVSRERGLGQSDTSATDQPGTVLGVNPTTNSSITNNAPPIKKQ